MILRRSPLRSEPVWTLAAVPAHARVCGCTALEERVQELQQSSGLGGREGLQNIWRPAAWAMPRYHLQLCPVVAQPLRGCGASWRTPVEPGGPQFVATKRNGTRNCKAVRVRGFTKCVARVGSDLHNYCLARFCVEQLGA
jgi:hypothetical protein